MSVKVMYSEGAVSRMRANVYGECTEQNWRACKDKWMEPENIRWLAEQRQNMGMPSPKNCEII